MGIFDFIKGGSNINYQEAIKNTSDADVVIWRYNKEDFNTNSTISVEPAEEAFFLYTDKEGAMQLKVFKDAKGGTVQTNNIPFFRSIHQMLTGGESRFRCKVFYIRTNLCQNFKWGTSSQIGPLEDVRHYTFKLAANGTYDLKIVNPDALMSNILGYGVSAVRQDEFSEKLRAKVVYEIVILLTMLFRHPEFKASLTRIQGEMLKPLGEALEKTLNDKYEKEWGIHFINFTINLSDVYDELAEHYLENNRMVQKKEEFNYQGKAYTTIQLFEMMNNMAKNPGNMASNAMGIGFGAGIGGSIGGSIGDTLGTILDNGFTGNNGIVGNNGGNSISGTTVGNEVWAGEPTAISSEEEYARKKADRKRRMLEAKEMLADGCITQEQYEQKIQEILREF